jgi:hypothetical protein
VFKALKMSLSTLHNSAAVVATCCKQVLLLSLRTIDEVEFKVEYNNVAEQVRKVENKITQLLKMTLWPYIKHERKSSSNEESDNEHNVLARIRFHRENPSFDLTINGREEKVSFSQIRIPYPLNLVFPLKAGVNNVNLAAKQLIGNSASPVCKIEQTEMTTYDNRSLPFHIDYCFHLLSGDCSNERKFGILTRTMKPGEHTPTTLKTLNTP